MDRSYWPNFLVSSLSESEFIRLLVMRAFKISCLLNANWHCWNSSSSWRSKLLTNLYCSNKFDNLWCDVFTLLVKLAWSSQAISQKLGKQLLQLLKQLNKSLLKTKVISDIRLCELFYLLCCVSTISSPCIIYCKIWKFMEKLRRFRIDLNASMQYVTKRNLKLYEIVLPSLA